MCFWDHFLWFTLYILDRIYCCFCWFKIFKLFSQIKCCCWTHLQQGQLWAITMLWSKNTETRNKLEDEGQVERAALQTAITKIFWMWLDDHSSFSREKEFDGLQGVQGQCKVASTKMFDCFLCKSIWQVKFFNLSFAICCYFAGQVWLRTCWQEEKVGGICWGGLLQFSRKIWSSLNIPWNIFL